MTTDQQAWSDGAWMQTYTGRAFRPTNPTPDDVDPLDIAHALSLICRYGGHTKWFYSVAEHCVLMSHAVPEEDALAALLHDATEAYVGDMVRPLKQQLPAYQLAEARVWSAVARRFDLGAMLELGPLPRSVKEADNRILLDERAALLTAPPHPWAVDELAPLGVQIEAWEPWEAEQRYLARLHDLAGDVATSPAVLR